MPQGVCVEGAPDTPPVPSGSPSAQRCPRRPDIGPWPPAKWGRDPGSGEKASQAARRPSETAAAATPLDSGRSGPGGALSPPYKKPGAGPAARPEAGTGLGRAGARPPAAARRHGPLLGQDVPAALHAGAHRRLLRGRAGLGLPGQLHRAAVRLLQHAVRPDLAVRGAGRRLRGAATPRGPGGHLRLRARRGAGRAEQRRLPHGALLHHHRGGRAAPGAARAHRRPRAGAHRRRAGAGRQRAGAAHLPGLRRLACLLRPPPPPAAAAAARAAPAAGPGPPPERDRGPPPALGRLPRRGRGGTEEGAGGDGVLQRSRTYTQHKVSSLNAGDSLNTQNEPEETMKKEKKSDALNIRGVLLHVMGDALGSVVVVITAIIFYVRPLQREDQCNWQCYIDPSLTIVMVIIILSSAFPLIKETAVILLQMVPKGVNMEELMSKLSAMPGISSVHEVHVWELVSGKVIATLHIKYQKDRGYQDTSRKIREIFHGVGIHNVTIQFEQVDLKAPVEQKDLCSSPCISKGCEKQLCCPPGALPLAHVNGCAEHNGCPPLDTYRSGSFRRQETAEVAIEVSLDSCLSDHGQALSKTQEDQHYVNSTHF
ncbi:calcium/manganese antiporter SLC30A10 isoform X1 [Ursus arctos]|uniref:calcium/manganese antiporter SLC30A10 isoform X1 n=1 Tax=Ursus arctos TaxID=9644 RepID=UPI0025470BAF|nr:calcium/manganese antiporter SLC30A10 isoform X1 [Ursus arctos]